MQIVDFLSLLPECWSVKWWRHRADSEWRLWFDVQWHDGQHRCPWHAHHVHQPGGALLASRNLRRSSGQGACVRRHPSGSPQKSLQTPWRHSLLLPIPPLSDLCATESEPARQLKPLGFYVTLSFTDIKLNDFYAFIDLLYSAIYIYVFV